MKALFKVLVIFIFVQTLYAQGWLPQGARSMGLANTSVALEDVFAFHNNPGALAFVSNFSSAVHYESRFLLRELQTQSFALVVPNARGAYSMGGQFYGYENFRTSRVGGGYSLKLTSAMALGVQLNYLNLRLDSYYGVRHGVTAEVGILAKINNQLSIAGSVINIGNTRVSTISDERFGTLIRLGAAYNLVDDVKLLAEIAQYVNHPTQVKGALEYNFKEKFYLRSGLSVQPVLMSFGTGLKWKRIQLDFGSTYHSIVGWTPGVSFVYNFHKKEVSE